MFFTFLNFYSNYFSCILNEFNIKSKFKDIPYLKKMGLKIYLFQELIKSLKTSIKNN